MAQALLLRATEFVQTSRVRISHEYNKAHALVVTRWGAAAPHRIGAAAAAVLCLLLVVALTSSGGGAAVAPQTAVNVALSTGNASLPIVAAVVAAAAGPAGRAALAEDAGQGLLADVDGSGPAITMVSGNPACAPVGCGYELLATPWRPPTARGPHLAPGCSDTPRPLAALLSALAAPLPAPRLPSGSTPPPRGRLLWIAFVGDSIVKAEFKELAAGLLGKGAPEPASAGGGRVSLARFADERHNCVKGGEASCFIAGSKEMYYYVPRVICCAAKPGAAKGVSTCGLYRLMPEDYEQVPDVIRTHTTGTPAARARSHVCASFVFMRKPADVVATVTPLVAAGAAVTPTAVVYNPALHPMAPVLRYTPERIKEETASMNAWLLGVQREQADAFAAAAMFGPSAAAAPWPTLFLQQLATPVVDAKVNPKHKAFMNSGRVDAFNAAIRSVWADYARSAAAAGMAPSRLLDSHRLAWTLLQRGATSTHDGVHLAAEFSKAAASVVVNAVIDGMAAQATAAAGACAQTAGAGAASAAGAGAASAAGAGAASATVADSGEAPLATAVADVADTAAEAAASALGVDAGDAAAV